MPPAIFAKPSKLPHLASPHRSGHLFGQLQKDGGHHLDVLALLLHSRREGLQQIGQLVRREKGWIGKRSVPPNTASAVAGRCSTPPAIAPPPPPPSGPAPAAYYTAADEDDGEFVLRTLSRPLKRG
jgi:hypothetical protein